MDQSASLPSRFSAQSLPSDGLVEITDTETGKTGSVRLSAYQSVASLLNDLFGSDEAREETLVQPKSPVAETEVKPSAKKTRATETNEPPKKPASAPKKTPSKTTAKKKPAAASKAEAGKHPEIIEDTGFKLVKESDSPVSYDVIDSSGNVFGNLRLLETGKFELTPSENASFSPSKHSSIIAAQARLFALLN